MKIHTILFLSFLCLSCKSPWSTGKLTSKAKVERGNFSPTLSFLPETALYNPLPSSVQLTFSDDVEMSSVTSSDVSVVGSGSCPLQMLLSSSKSANTLTIFVDTTSCAHGDTLRVSLDMNGVLNSLGQRGRGLHSETYTLNTDNAPSPTTNLVSGSYGQFPGSFTLVFDSSIDMTSVTDSMVEVSCTGGCPASALTSFVKTGSVATVTYSASGCADGDSLDIRIHVSGLLDTLGRHGAGILYRRLTLDQIGVDASLVSLDVASGDVNPLPALVSITFPHDVDMNSVNFSDFLISSNGSCPSGALSNLSKSGQVAQLSLHTTGCASGDSITFTLPMSSILDLSGNSGTGNVGAHWRFVNSAPAAPVFNLASATVSSMPVAIVMTFQDSVDLASVNPASLSVFGSGSCTPQALGSISTAAQTVTATFIPVGCVHGDSLTLTLDMTLVTNSVGMSGTGSVTRTFTLDSAGPNPPVFSIDTGSFAQVPNSIQLDFGIDTEMQSVNSSTIQLRGTGSCSNSPLSNMVKNGTTVTLSLNASGCADQDQIQLQVLGTQITDLVGNSGTLDVTKTFTIDSTVPAAPTINITPGVVANLPTQLQFNFDPAIDMASVGAEDFVIQGTGACSSSPLVTFLKSASQAKLNLSSAACGHGDSFIVTLDMSGIVNTLGTTGSGIFRNVFSLDLQGPNHPTLSLAGGNITSMPSTLAFTFSSDTAMGSITLADFSLQGTGGCSSASILSLNKVARVATVAIDASTCTSDDQLTVKALMSGITDELGNSGFGEASATFVLDTIGPGLPTITPASATMNHLPVTISLVFPSDTEMSSVSAADFSVNATGNCQATFGTYAASGQTAFLTLQNASCLHGDTVTFRVYGSGIRDELGNAGSGTVSATYLLDNQGIPDSAMAITPASGHYRTLPTGVDFSFPPDTDMASVDLADFSSVTTGLCLAQPLLALTKTGQVASLSLNTFGCLSGNTVTLTLNMAGINDSFGNTGTGMTQVTYQLDNSGPASATLNTSNGTYASLNSSFTFTFSSDTDMSTVSGIDLSISGTGECAASSLLTMSKFGQSASVTLDLSSCLSSDSFTATLDMTGITDVLGNPGTGSVGLTQTLDNMGPNPPTVNRASAIVSVLPNSLQYSFTADTDMASVTSSDFTVTGTGSCLANPFLSLSKSGQVATVSLNRSACVSGDEISLTLSMTGVTDTLGNPGTGSLVRNFILDDVGPATPSVSVSSGTLATLPTSIVITFSADTDMSSLSLSDFSATGSGSCQGNPLTTLNKSGQSATLSLITSGCANGHTLAFTLAMSGVTDAIGNPGYGTVTRSYSLDNVGPAAPNVNLSTAILSSLPTSLVFTFPADADMSSVTLADFTAVGSGGCLSNALTGLSILGQIATVSFSASGCSQADSLTISLTMAGVSDATGNSGSGILTRTFTLDSIGPAAPTIGLASATLMVLPTSVTVTFSADTDMSSVSLADFSAIGSGSCPANALTSVAKTGQTATLTLNTSGCLHNNNIAFSVHMAAVSDAIGNVGSGSVIRNFLLDTIGPANPSVSQSGGSWVTMPTSVVFTFAADVDMASVTAGAFSAVGTGLCAPNPISSVSVSGKTATVTLLPMSCILNSTIRLDLNMNAVKDLTGNTGSGIFRNTYTKIL